MEKKYCCICGKPLKGYGNNPWPVVDDPEARCCDDCNYEKVLPARMAGKNKSEETVEPLDFKNTKITRKCPMCGAISTVTVPIEGMKKYEEGEILQRAFPELTATEREILITGLCVDCQDKIFR